MLKRLTRKLFILFALGAYLTLGMPSTPAQGSGYSLSGSVDYSGSAVSGPVSIYKWNGSSWVYHGSASASCLGLFYYDTGGPGLFMGQVDGGHAIYNYLTCSFLEVANIYGSSSAELSAGHPSAYMYIYVWSDPEAW